MGKLITEKGIELTNDTKILACALSYYNDDLIFITNDLALKQIAKLFLSSKQISSIEENKNPYTGFTEAILTDEESERFYSDM